MLKKVLGLLFSTLISSVISQTTKDSPTLTYYIPQHPTQDNSTYANIDYIQSTSVQIDLNTFDWVNNVITGSITHDMVVL